MNELALPKRTTLVRDRSAKLEYIRLYARLQDVLRKAVQGMSSDITENENVSNC